MLALYKVNPLGRVYPELISAGTPSHVTLGRQSLFSRLYIKEVLLLCITLHSENLDQAAETPRKHVGTRRALYEGIGLTPEYPTSLQD